MLVKFLSLVYLYKVGLVFVCSVFSFGAGVGSWY